MVLIRRDEGYWRQYAKIARSGLIALLVLLSLPEVGLCQNKVAPKSQTENSQAKPQAPSQTPVFIHNPGPYEPHCASPPTREDAEYCQEWGATIATQKQAEWAFYQLIASVVGIGAVIVTLVFTAKATAAAVDSVDASQRSADAAARAAEIAERALVDLERPFVYCSVRTEGLVSGQLIINGLIRNSAVSRSTMELSVYNHGRTPARITRFLAVPSLSVHGSICEPINPQIEGGIEMPVGTVCVAGEPFPWPVDLRTSFLGEDKAIADNQKSVWVHGFVRYQDIFGNHHINGFALVFETERQRFTRRGGAQYNYERTEKEADIPLIPTSLA